MAQFSRIRPWEKPKDTEGSDKDVSLDDLGFLFCKHNGIWNCESRLVEPGGRVHDVTVHPPCQLGRPGDVASTSDSKWWKKNSRSEWIFQYYLIPPPAPNLIVGKLTVLENLSIPVVDNEIPVYDTQGRLKGHISFNPVSED